MPVYGSTIRGPTPLARQPAGASLACVAAAAVVGTAGLALGALRSSSSSSSVPQLAVRHDAAATTAAVAPAASAVVTGVGEPVAAGLETRSVVIAAVMLAVVTVLAILSLAFRSKVKRIFMSGEVVFQKDRVIVQPKREEYTNQNTPKARKRSKFTRSHTHDLPGWPGNGGWGDSCLKEFSRVCARASRLSVLPSFRAPFLRVPSSVQVIDYDESKMLRCGAFCQTRGSVAVNSSVLGHVAVTWLIAAGTFGLVNACLSETGLRVLDTKSVSDFVDIFNGLVGFLLGLFVSISLGRWWSCLFNHYGGESRASHPCPRDDCFDLPAPTPPSSPSPPLSTL